MQCQCGTSSFNFLSRLYFTLNVSSERQGWDDMSWWINDEKLADTSYKTNKRSSVDFLTLFSFNVTVFSLPVSHTHLRSKWLSKPTHWVQLYYSWSLESFLSSGKRSIQYCNPTGAEKLTLTHQHTFLSLSLSSISPAVCWQVMSVHSPGNLEGLFGEVRH